MLEIQCPSCQAALGIEESQSGGAVQCPQCGERIATASPIPVAGIPVASRPTASAQQGSQPSAQSSAPRIRTGSSRVRRRKKSKLVIFISLMVHCGIFAATIAGGYFIWQKVEQWKQHERIAAEKRRQPAPPEHPRRPLKRQERREPTTPPIAQRPRDVVPAVPEPPAEPILPFADFPQTFALPPIEDKSIVTLLPDVTKSELSFVSSDESLIHKVNKLIWQEDEKSLVVAGLAIRKNALLFRWLGDAPDDAQKAVVNSLVELHRQDQTYKASLRTPTIVEPFTFDLTDAVHYVKCDCPFPPDPKQICVSIGTDSSYPGYRREGCKLECLRWQDSAMLLYTEANYAATKISLGRKGNLAALTITSRYILPSGDSEPMSIGQGNRKRKELENLIGQAHQASVALPQLRSKLISLQSNLRRAQNSSVIAQQKFLLIQGLTSQIAAAQKRVAVASQLINNRPAVERELSELKHVAALAQQLHLNAQLTYRFYHVVGDTEVDLVIAQ